MAQKSSAEAIEALISHIKKYGKDRSWAELTNMFAPRENISSDWARCTLRMRGISPSGGRINTDDQADIDDRVQNIRANKENSRARVENDRLLARIVELEGELGLLNRVKAHDSGKFEIKPSSKSAKNEATAIIQWSDWHVDEVVTLETTNGLNEYNKDIAKKRAYKLSENTIKLLDSQRSAVNIQDVVLHLGGDAIGGYIHPELQQTNSMPPLQGIFYAKELLVSCIDYLLKHGNIKNLIVVTSRGNHPRLTPKMQYANDYSMNLETYLYISLGEYYSGNSRVSFKIDQSELSYVTVYDKILRFFHGHQIRFLGGVGGLTIPLYKALHRWNANIRAYYNFMCDKHTYSTPTPDCQCNGSLKGYDTFAVSHGFSFQPPLQSFTLLDIKRGITIKAPIFCE